MSWTVDYNMHLLCRVWLEGYTHIYFTQVSLWVFLQLLFWIGDKVSNSVNFIFTVIFTLNNDLTVVNEPSLQLLFLRL